MCRTAHAHLARSTLCMAKYTCTLMAALREGEREGRVRVGEVVQCSLFPNPSYCSVPLQGLCLVETAQSRVKVLLVVVDGCSH